MATVAVETTADTSAATSAVRSPLALAPPPVPPRSFLTRNTETEKYFSITSKSSFLNFDSFTMASKQETSTTAQLNGSSTPSPPPPPADFQLITSPLPPDLPPPPDFYPSPTSSSPPPPPPPPSYLFPELSSGDLPLPPPPQVLMNMDPQSRPVYICSYDPPSPEIKSEYDPKLPPEFTLKANQNPLSPPPPPVPPPPRPTPPPPPTPPVRQASKENLYVTPPSTCRDEDSLSTKSFPDGSSSALYLASGEETQTKDSMDGTSCNYPAKNVTDTAINTEYSVDGRPTYSGLSSSTLTASLLLTPESGLSPLPPHALRVSPVPTDANTSSRMTDDLNITSCSDTTSTPNIFDSRDTTFDIDTPEVTPQLSEIIGTLSPTPNEVKMNKIMNEILADSFSNSEVTPQLSEVSGSHSATPTGENINSVSNENQDEEKVDMSPKRVVPSSLLLDIFSTSPPDSSESERYEDTAGNDSLSETTDYSLTEKMGSDQVPGSFTVTSNTEVAQMSSPFSTEPTSLFSFPTDSDTISADIDSLAADTLSPMADLESYPADVDTATIDSISTTRAADMFLTSSSGFSDTAYATGDSNMESATMSPAFTNSCTITPVPADFATPMSTNPTTTPVPSPIPSSPLPYFDAIPHDSMLLSQSHTSSVGTSLSAMLTSTSRMIVSASEHRSEFHAKTSNSQPRLVPSQLSDSLLSQDDQSVSTQTLLDVSHKTSTNNEINLNNVTDKIESNVLQEKKNTEAPKKEKDISTGGGKTMLQDQTLMSHEKSADIEAKPGGKHISPEKKPMNSTEAENKSIVAGQASSNKNESLKTVVTNGVNLDGRIYPQDLGPTENAKVNLTEQKSSDEKNQGMNGDVNQKGSIDVIDQANLVADESSIPELKDAEIAGAKTKSERDEDDARKTKDSSIQEMSSYDAQTSQFQNKNGNMPGNFEAEKKVEEKLDLNCTDIYDDNEYMICKELTDKEGLTTHSDEIEKGDAQTKEIDSHDKSSSTSIMLDLSCDDHVSPCDAIKSSSSYLVRMKSYPSSPISSSPQQNMPTRFSSCGGSMSPKVPVSPARSPLPITKETDITLSPKSPGIIPLSKSPEEAMEFLNTLVGNMETLSADLPHSPVSKESEENIDSKKSVVEVNAKASESESETPQKPADVSSEACENSDSDLRSNDLLNESDEMKVDNVLSPSTPSSPPSKQPEDVTVVPSLANSPLDVKQDPEGNNNTSSTDQLSPVLTNTCCSDKPNVLSTCMSSDIEFISSHNSQALHATNIKASGNLVDVPKMPNELNLDSKVDEIVTLVKPLENLLNVENKNEENIEIESCNVDNSENSPFVEKKEPEYTNVSNLSSQKDILDNVSLTEKLHMLANNDSPTSISSSLHSIVEDAVHPPPASRAKTPPLPPPRSCVNTPRPGMGAPLPPPRQYMLIPINSSQVSSRRNSPPPAPPRSTSVRRSPPPPPPRSTIATPAGINEWIDFPPLPPPPTSVINTPSTPPKLTPVPEESSFPTTPIPPKESAVESSLSHRKCPCGADSEGHDNAVKVPKTVPEFESLDKFPQDTPAGDVESSALSCTSSSPPTVPPMPEEDTEEEPPPPPPPPIEFRDQQIPPFPIPPPPESVASPPPPPARSRIVTPPLPPPPKIIFSPEEYDLRNSQSSGNVTETNNSSILLASDMAASSSDSPAMSVPTSSSAANDVHGAPILSTPALSSSAPAVPPPPPPMMPAYSSTLPFSSTIPGPPPLSTLPPPRCATPQSKPMPNSALWTVSPYGKVVLNRNDLPLPSPEEEIRKTFHNVKNWGLLDYGADTLAVYTQLRPNIQMGPQCGLVALSMASQVFPETKEIADLLKEAKDQKFTSHGEMFSSENMSKLANGINGMEAEVRRDILCDPKALLELLIHGNLVLAPYDSDLNHMPNLRNGHKAHWGIICGCLVQCQSLNMYMGGTSKIDSRVDNLWHLRPRSRRGAAPSRDGSVTPSTPLIPGSPRLGHRILKTPETPLSSTPDTPLRESDNWSVCSSRVNTPMIPEILNDDLRMVVLWRQGKSRNLIAAPLEKLCESNDQLLEYPSPTNEVESEFIIGSVQDGLASQVVVLHKTKSTLSDLVGILQDKQGK